MSRVLDKSQRLFEETAPVRVRNLKLFPGTDADTTPEQIVDQVTAVVAEIENGTLQVVDLRKRR